MKHTATLLMTIATAGLLSLGCDRSTAVVAQPTNAASTATSSASVAPEGVQDKSFDDLKFEMELEEEFQRSMLTPEVEKLFGSQIRIRGYIFPTLKKKGLKQFVLVRDNLECCFGPGAALFDCILVHMNEGKTAEYSIRPVAVEGTLSFDQFIDGFDGSTRAIYRIDGDSVE